MEILEKIKEISQDILPIVGVIALIVFIILVIELIKTVKNANAVLIKSKGTVDLVDESIKKAQAPLDSAVRISHTVDIAHNAAIQGIEEAKVLISKNADVIKEKINDLSKKEIEVEKKENFDQEDELKGV